MSKGSPAEIYAEKSLQSEGWTVINTNFGFPDLFCFKDGRLMFVEVKTGADKLRAKQKETIQRLKSLGIDATTMYIKEGIFTDNQGALSVEDATKITFRLKKGLLKDLQRYALDHDMTDTELFTLAIEEFLRGKKA